MTDDIVRVVERAAIAPSTSRQQRTQARGTIASPMKKRTRTYPSRSMRNTSQR